MTKLRHPGKQHVEARKRLKICKRQNSEMMKKSTSCTGQLNTNVILPDQPMESTVKQHRLTNPRQGFALETVKKMLVFKGF